MLPDLVLLALRMHFFKPFFNVMPVLPLAAYEFGYAVIRSQIALSVAAAANLSIVQLSLRVVKLTLVNSNH